MGELSSPVCFELAKLLKCPPAQIAQEIANSMGAVPGVARLEVAGAGYLNVYLIAGSFRIRDAAGIRRRSLPAGAHARHRRAHKHQFRQSRPHRAPAECGARRCLFAVCCGLGPIGVEVQNYIDNTGYKVADVVLRFQPYGEEIACRMARRWQPTKVRLLRWDLYARVRLSRRRQSAAGAPQRPLSPLKKDTAPSRVGRNHLGCDWCASHLNTMERLGVHLRCSPAESESCPQFWDTGVYAAQERGAIHLSTAARLAGLLGDAQAEPRAKRPKKVRRTTTPKTLCDPTVR